MKTTILCLTAVTAFSLLGVEMGGGVLEPEGAKVKRREFLERMHTKKTGGNIKRPGVQRGAVAFLNAAVDKVPTEKLEDLVARLQNAMKIEIRNKAIAGMPEKGLKDVMKANGAEAAVFLKWDEDCDLPMLYAPEQNWAVVNMRLLAEGADEKQFNLRLVKQATRAFSYVCGAGGAMGGDGIMDVSSVKGLDAVSAELSIDILARFDGYLKGIGVTPYEEVTYHQACIEGWAPEPTNEVQRVIWEKVKAEQSEQPSNPLKITPGMKPKGK